MRASFRGGGSFSASGSTETTLSWFRKAPPPSDDDRRLEERERLVAQAFRLADAEVALRALTAEVDVRLRAQAELARYLGRTAEADALVERAEFYAAALKRWSRGQFWHRG